MWPFGRSSSSDVSNSSLGEATLAQKQRSKQIIGLKNQVNGVVELERDVRYRVTFSVCESVSLTLDIYLPPRFPLDRPQLTVSPPVLHSWVDTQMLICGSPLIEHFGPHSDLGRAVKQIIQEFEDHPPQLLSTPVGAMSQVVPPYPTQPPNMSFAPYSFTSAPQTVPSEEIDSGSVSTGITSATSSSMHTPYTGAVSYQVPDSLPGVTEMSDEELEKYLNDEDAELMINKFISKMDVIHKVQEDMEHMFQDNEKQARDNLDLEPRIQESWEKLQNKIIDLQSKKEISEKLHSKQLQLLERYDKRKATSDLRTLSQESDADSEIIAEDFLSHKRNASSFLQDYLQQRKLHHSRAAKVEMFKYQRS